MFAAGLLAHSMFAAAAIIFNRRPFDILEFTTAIMQLKGYARTGSPVQHDQRYDKYFFHLVTKVKIRTGYLHIILLIYCLFYRTLSNGKSMSFP